MRNFLLVTSNYHTGCARRIFLAVEKQMGYAPAFRTIATADKYFSADAWWRNREGQKTSELLGTVTTLEDVTTLQDTDRFKTQFIAVASRKLRDPLLQLRRGLYALGQGFGGELLPLQAELVAQSSGESEKLDDLMGDLIEVAELDTGKREFQTRTAAPLAC